ncbi:MAG: response regulator [Chloroflexi bacterium]|nr:MAG: response regulator [Chloroflexota bacterium]
MASQATILVIEDSVLSQRLVEVVLTAQGFRVVEARTGEEGLRKALDERPDLILLDVHLPDMSGYDAVARLRARPETAQVPIIALTASASAEEEARARKAGCDGYIAKPINTRTFPDQVRQHLR